MHDVKRRIAMGCTAALALAMLTGCQSVMWSHQKGGRTAAQYANDQRITSQIQTDLKNEPVYKFQDVKVNTYDGVVQLSGFTRTQQQKERASQVAQQVYGVRRVDNAISLIQPETATPTGREYHAPIVEFPGQNTQNPNTSPNQNQPVPNQNPNQPNR